jgi:type II secretory ATPase GspE/PulE/Tfp pilus assembly ATPase PilB-like protein
MMTAPAKGEPRTFYQSLELAVTLGFSANAQAMLKADVKTLAEVDEAKAKANRDLKCKANRRYWQQQIGSKIKDYRNSLIKRLAPATSEGAQDNASWESVKRKVIAEIITQAQKKEASSIKDMSAFIKDLQSALARIPANA